MQSELVAMKSMAKLPFEKLDGIVREHGAGFIAVGNALIAIRDSEGYKDEFKTFESYVADRLGYSRQEAYKIMAAASVTDRLAGNLGIECRLSATKLPRNTRQALRLGVLPKDMQADCWSDVLEVAKEQEVPVTERLVASKVKEYLDLSSDGDHEKPKKRKKAEEEDDRPEEEEDDTPDVIAEILAAVNSEKLKASRKQLEALAEFDEDTQAEILKSVLAGRESLGTAIANGCAADPTIDEQIKEQASGIESVCRQITDFVQKSVKGLADKWLDGMGARELALEEFKKGCATLRSCKSVAVCPKCGGTGCRSCLNTGRVNKFTLQQLS